MHTILMNKKIEQLLSIFEHSVSIYVYQTCYNVGGSKKTHRHN